MHKGVSYIFSPVLEDFAASLITAQGPIPCSLENPGALIRSMHRVWQTLRAWTLKSYFMHAQGVVYTKSLETGWKPKGRYRAMSEEAHQLFRDKFHIICEGHNLPPPIPNFVDMKFPPCILKHLEGKGIKRPTPIQLQVGGSEAALHSRGSSRYLTIGLAMCAVQRLEGKGSSDILPLLTWILNVQSARTGKSRRSSSCG